MDALLDWLRSLPTAALYAALAFASAIENIFPPVPADTVVAFGSFLAARGKGSLIGSFLATWLGNIAGASAMFWVGRKYGTDFLKRRGFGDSKKAEGKMKAMYGKYGYGAFFLSRFVPGVRAVVPPFAGAAGVPFLPAIAVMAVASGIWYGILTWLAFRVGSNWEAFAEQIGNIGKIAAIAAAALLLIGGIIWYVRRKRAA